MQVSLRDSADRSSRFHSNSHSASHLIGEGELIPSSVSVSSSPSSSGLGGEMSSAGSGQTSTSILSNAYHTPNNTPPTNSYTNMNQTHEVLPSIVISSVLDGVNQLPPSVVPTATVTTAAKHHPQQSATSPSIHQPPVTPLSTTTLSTPSSSTTTTPTPSSTTTVAPSTRTSQSPFTLDFFASTALTTSTWPPFEDLPLKVVHIIRGLPGE